MPITSKTEDKLFEAMQRIGLNPKRQYLISKHHVDFAFPKEKIVIEVDGIHHRTRWEVERDEKRRDVAESLGWKVKRFTAEEVHENSDRIAWKIKEILGRYKRREEESYAPNLIKEEEIPNSHPLFWIVLIVIGLVLIYFLLLKPNTISSNIDSSIENSKIDKIIQDFRGTDWKSQGDSSPIVRNFCSAVCSPTSLTTYAIGGQITKVIYCSCGNIDMFKGTAEGVRQYIFDYEGNVLKEISVEEYKQRLADYHKNNP